MNKCERGEIYGMIAVVTLIVTIFFFQPEFKGFLGWEKFLVGIYNQCIAFVLPFCFVNLLHIKSKVLKELFFILLFLVIDSTVEVRLDFPTSIWSYILIIVGIALWILAVLFMRRFANNRDNPNYTLKKKRIELIVFICTAVAAMIVFLVLCNLKYHYFTFD